MYRIKTAEKILIVVLIGLFVFLLVGRLVVVNYVTPVLLPLIYNLDAAFFFLTPILTIGFPVSLYGVYTCALFFAYVVKGYAVYKMAVNEGIGRPFLSMIPFGQDYILGTIAEKSKSAGYFGTYVSGAGIVVFRVIRILVWFSRFVDPLGFVIIFLEPLIYIVFKLYYVWALRLIYDQRSEGYALPLVMSYIFDSIAEAVVLYRKKDVTTFFEDLPEALLPNDKKSFDEVMTVRYGGADTNHERNGKNDNKDILQHRR